MGQKLSKLSCCRRRHRGAAGRSSAVDLPPTPAQKSEDASSFVGATLSGREISPSILPAPHSNHQPTGSRPLSAEKERNEPLKPVSGELSLRGSDIFTQKVNSLSSHLVLLRRHVSQQAWGKGRALLEALGLSGAQIAKCYGMHLLNEEEAVQHGLQVWLEGGTNTTWEVLLKAMETAEIDVQQGEGLKEELRSNAGGVHVVNEEEVVGASATAESTSALLLQPPSLEHVYRLVVPKMASEWHKVGVLCGVTVEVLRVIREDTSDTTRRCCRMFESWMEKTPGTGNKPRTWSTLLEAVQSGYGAATREGIEAELRSLRSEGEGLARTTQDKSLRAKLGYYYNKACIQDNPLLASSTMQYVKLNLVQPEQRRPVEGRVREVVSVHLAKGGVQQIPHEMSLEYQDILTFTPPTGISRQRVLIEGVAGSGKSTLAQRICHDWSIDCYAQDYEVVVLVTLRSLPKDQQKLSLEDLIFTSVEDEHTVKEIAQFITAHKGRRALFVFDGFDELSNEMQKKSIIRSILDGRLAPQSSFVVTTRPISAESLYHCVDRRVEISGFGEEEVKKYVTEYFASSNPSAGEKLLSTLSLRPHIERLCYVPLLLLMVCYIVSLDGDSAELPRTLHQLFEYLIILTLNHNLERAGRKECARSLQDVSRLCPSFDKLTELALKGILKDTIIFSKLNFEVDSAFHGLFNCIVTRNRFGIVSCTWHFLHLAVQEYMAALAVAKKTPKEQVTFWKQHLTMKYNKEGHFVLTQDRYHAVFLFYSGLTGLSTPGIQSMLLDTLNTVVKPRISESTPLPELCAVVAESSNVQLAQSILSPCGPKVEIDGGYLENVDVAWCMTEYFKQVDGAGIRIDGYDVANFLISQLGDISTLGKVELPGFHYVDGLSAVRQFLLKQTQLKCVMFGRLKDTKKDVIDTVKDVLTHHKESLEEVTLRGSKAPLLGRIPIEPFVDSLVACQRLCSLELGKVTLSLQSLLAVVKGMHNLRALGLKEVSLLDERSLTASDTYLIASSVEHHPSLREVTVRRTVGGGHSESLIPKGTVEGVARRHDVEKLIVSQRGIAPALVRPICAVMRAGSLRTLGIGGLCKPDQVVQVLKDLPHCTHLHELQLKLELSLSDEVIPSAIEAGLSKCTTLQKLTVRGSPPSVTPALLKAVTVIRSLEEVTLDECDYGGVDKEVVGFLSQLKQLRKVEMTLCRKLSPSLIATICGGLCSSNSVEEVVVTVRSLVKPLVVVTTPVGVEDEDEEVGREDVTDSDVLKAVETAVRRSTSVKRINIEGSHLRWTNVATAVLKGAAQSKPLREVELQTPLDSPPLKEVLHDVRRANPKLRLVLKAGDLCVLYL